MKDWQRQVIADAADQPEAAYAALARWAGVSESTVYKARRREPEFDQAITAARSGTVAAGDVVSFEEFIRSGEFLDLGIKGVDPDGTVLPVVASEARKIVEGNFAVVLMTGSLGSGKTFCSALCLTYLIYKLLLEKNPHRRLGLDPNSVIVFAVQSQTQKKAKANDYNLLRNFINGSKWFSMHAPIDDRLKAKIAFIGRNIEVRPAGPNPQEFLGENCFAGLLDEANFYHRVRNSARAVHGRDYDQAREAFESLLRRQHSRFDLGLAGPIFIASSKRYAGDFTDEILADFRDSDSLFVYDHTTWSADPARYEGKPWFKMFSGDRLRPPRIIGDDEITDRHDDQYILDIPADFKRSFKRDPVGSLMEIAGHSCEVFGGFFTDMAALLGAATLDQNLFRCFDVVADATLLLPEPHTIKLENPESHRHVHLDLALTGDCAAIAIGHIAKYDDRGLPVIHCDAIARVRPPAVGQIQIDSFHALIEALKLQFGVPIASVSTDAYQSYDLQQRLSRLGLMVGRISADQTEVNDPMRSYETLRNAVNEGRFYFPADDQTVEELKLLQIDRSASRGHGKVDHLPGKTKDVSDCLSVVAFYLTHRVPAWTLAGRVKGASFAAAINQAPLGGQITSIPMAQTGAMELIRAARGMPSR